MGGCLSRPRPRQSWSPALRGGDQPESTECLGPAHTASRVPPACRVHSGKNPREYHTQKEGRQLHFACLSHPPSWRCSVPRGNSTAGKSSSFSERKQGKGPTSSTLWSTAWRDTQRLRDTGSAGSREQPLSRSGRGSEACLPERASAVAPEGAQAQHGSHGSPADPTQFPSAGGHAP